MPEINFFWDPLSDNILQERDETGAVTAEYTAEPGLYGNIISQSRGGVESQFHYDAQGSTLAVTDDNQNVTDTFAYNAFGEVTERTGTTEVPFQYIGRKGYYTDSVNGQIMARRRPYEPVSARWLAQDPLSRVGGTLILVDTAQTLSTPPNWRINAVALVLRNYAYCRSNPVRFIDPSGCLEWSHRVESEPDIEGVFGYEIKIRQTLTNDPPLTAAAGSQTWQRNDVRTVALVSAADSCSWEDDRKFRLDVNDIGSKRTPIEITDTVGVRQGDQPAVYCLFVQAVVKQLGLRPFSVAGGVVTFDSDPLPTGNNYEATKEQWELAGKMSKSPILSANVVYMFFQRNHCNCCTKEDKKKAGDILKKEYGGVDPSVGTLEYLKYAELGTWYAFVGLP